MINIEIIKAKLLNTIESDRIEINDDSHKHAGHKEAVTHGGGHYEILIVSKLFEGKSLILRHRMIYQALREDQPHIHALKIRAYTPKEYSQTTSST